MPRNFAPQARHFDHRDQTTDNARCHQANGNLAKGVKVDDEQEAGESYSSEKQVEEAEEAANTVQQDAHVNAGTVLG